MGRWAPFGICLLTADQTVLFANQAAGRLFGRCSSDCVGKTLTEPGQTSARLERFTRATGYLEMLRTNRRCPLNLRTKKMRSPNSAWPPSSSGSNSGCPEFRQLPRLLTLRDVSRELELENDRDRLAAVAEESPYPIVELDRDATLLYVNPAMAEMLCRFGYDRRETQIFSPAQSSGACGRMPKEARPMGRRGWCEGDACYR